MDITTTGTTIIRDNRATPVQMTAGETLNLIKARSNGRAANITKIAMDPVAEVREVARPVLCIVMMILLRASTAGATVAAVEQTTAPTLTQTSLPRAPVTASPACAGVGIAVAAARFRPLKQKMATAPPLHLRHRLHHQGHQWLCQVSSYTHREHTTSLSLCITPTWPISLILGQTESMVLQYFIQLVSLCTSGALSFRCQTSQYAPTCRHIDEIGAIRSNGGHENRTHNGNEEEHLRIFLIFVFPVL